MSKEVNTIGYLCAGVGMNVCLITTLIRLTGRAYIFGMETMSFFMGGVALMVVACVLKLYDDEEEGEAAEEKQGS